MSPLLLRYVMAGLLLGFWPVAAGCKGGTSPEEGTQELVNRLAQEHLGFVSSGTGFPHATALTIKIVGRGQSAVPFLVEALKSEDGIKVGYAAYCLKELGSPEGLKEARARLVYFEGRRNPYSGSYLPATFAVIGLKEYIRELEQKTN